jgi:inositol phosphorylceramide mannosyltransferase catalytic subunit
VWYGAPHHYNRDLLFRLAGRMIAEAICSKLGEFRVPIDPDLRSWEEKLPESCLGAAIPRIIHQIFFPAGTMPAVLEQNLVKIKSLNPGWEHRLYDDADMVEFIRSSYGPRVLAQYDRINPKYGAARADLFRYLLMYRVGGVYLDIKSTLRKPLDEALLPEDVYVLSPWTGAQFKGWGNYRMLRPFGGKELQQWHIIAAAGHPFLRAVIARVLYHLETYNPLVHDTGRMGVMWSTGPIAYTLAIAPLLSRHPCRIVGGHDELGLEYTIFGAADRAHKSVFRYHYTDLNEPVVRLRGARKLAWFVLGPIHVHLVHRLRRLHAAIARRISRLYPDGTAS